MSVKKAAGKNGKHAGGRPSKRTPALVAKIAEANSYGLCDQEAVDIVKISIDTLWEWRKIPEFSEALKSAISTRKLVRLRRIDSGAPGWQGTAWIMERCFPLEYSRPEIQLNQQLSINVADKPAPFPMVRVISVPDDEFEECLTKEAYKQLSNGSLERVEGSMRVLIFRQSAAKIEDI
jgi:hypothetical protein